MGYLYYKVGYTVAIANLVKLILMSPANRIWQIHISKYHSINIALILQAPIVLDMASLTRTVTHSTKDRAEPRIKPDK